MRRNSRDRGLKPNAKNLLEIVAKDPCLTPRPHEKLVGDLPRACSRSINMQHRFIYYVLDDSKPLTIIRMWPHEE